ncbi:hypothetical protein ZEAMMB73_Zm00001d030073 [Zea mays]|uniref:Uncharacterized protein n=1 Tax=Zea mays TaxID=4577 RepID=A0A1D6K9G3_MAIZE|nr:hypothetical protein ZEAMMB73_Zm00001d030073 [Zea mays]
MVLASIAATLFVILLLFSLPLCLHFRATPFSVEGVGACASFLYSSNTSPNTDPRSGYCTSTRTFHSMSAPSFSPSSDILFVFPAFALFFLPNLLPSPTVTAASRPMLFDAGTGRVSLAPGLSSCVPLRTRWRLPRLGYLGDEESSGILPMSPLDVQVFVVSFSSNEQDLVIHAVTTTGCSSLVFLALASIRSFLRPYWRNGLHGV